MTKLKNTKKGMAKKALSISLVAAMLATSNVPVWAAEFSDGADVVETVDVFSDDTVVEEAPVVEETVVEEEAQLQAASDYVVDTNLELASADWNTTLKLAKKSGVPATEAEKLNVSKNGVPTAITAVEVYHNDSLHGRAEDTNGFTWDVINSRISEAPGLKAYTEGKKVSIKLYVTGEHEAVATFSTTLKPVDITNASITYTDGNVKEYNGKAQEPTEISVTYADGKIATLSQKEVIVKYDDVVEAVNVKEGSYKYHVEGVEAKGFKGTTEATGEFSITPVVATKDNLSVVVSGTTTYNGKNTKPNIVVTDRLSGNVIPSELYNVYINSTDAGDYTNNNVVVGFWKSAIVGTDTKATYSNFDSSAPVNAECITGSYKIEALDLSKLGDKYTVTVNPRETSNSPAIEWEDITFTDKATGKKYTGAAEIAKILPTDEVWPELSNNETAGTGTLKICKKPTVTTKNIINEYTTNVIVADNVISKEDIALPKGTKLTATSTPLASRTTLTSLDAQIQAILDASVYTGSALEPLKAVFENIVWAEADPSGADVKYTLGTDYTLTYAENTDSKAVSGKKATVTLQFIGKYVGTVSYDFEIAQATAYVTGAKIPYVAGKSSYEANVKVVTKNGSAETAVPTSYYTVDTKTRARKIGDKAIANVIFTNPNYLIDNGTGTNVDKCAYINGIESELVGKSLTDSTIVATIEGTYVYTGKEIKPVIVVKDGDVLLKEGTDYEIVSKLGVEAGNAKLVIKGIGNYDGRLTLDYTITKADMATATVVSKKGTGKESNYDVDYDGLAQTPDIKEVKIGDTVLKAYDPITKTGDYELVWDEDAVEVGTYDFTITAVASSTKVQGTFKGTFKVRPSVLSAHFAEKATPATDVGTTPLPVAKTGAYYTGEEISIANFKTKYVLADNKTNTVLVEGKDYRLVYENNVDAGIGAVKAYGLGNHAAVNDEGKEIAIATLSFYIEGKGIITMNQVKKINDVEYAGGFTVEPEVVVVDPKNPTVRLVQGKDYTVETTVRDVTEAGKTQKAEEVTIKGKGAYVARNADNKGFNPTDATLTWKVTKKDIANTYISVKDGVVTVMNGTVLVPSSEYDVTTSADGKTITVTAKADSKNYTGSKELSAEDEKVGKAMIEKVKVVNNRATVVLSGEVDNATGYDYVISTENDYQNGRLVNGINKNVLATDTNYYYLQKGTYYAYCHAWTRDENGKKVFGEWSNIYQFTVTTTTPDQPVITSVTAKGSTVTVKYTKSANATGYDVVLGSAARKVNGEKRPVNYGTLVSKVYNGNTVTATFKNVKPGTYYAGLHAYNRTAVDNKKVFSPWSNVKSVKVK